MSIIQTGSQGPVLTKEQLTKRTNQQIRVLLNNQFRQIIQVTNQVAELVWNNAEGLTPKEVVDALGTDAVQLFQIGAVMAGAINAITPNTLPTEAPYNVTINQDGSVTVGDKK